MKALVYEKYGGPGVLRLGEIEKPRPQADEVLVRVHAASINAGDWLALTGKPFITRLVTGAPLRPKVRVLGGDFAGIVAEVGNAVTRFKAGDRVFGDISDVGQGGFAEFAAAPERLTARIPDTVPYETAAAIPVAGLTALQAVRDHGQVQPGMQVLVYGASGGVGNFTVQAAKAFGAEVTAVCSTRKIESAYAAGADHVIDYTRTDFSRSGEQYDLVLAANGYHSLDTYLRVLKPEGRYVCIGGTMRQIFEAMLLGPSKGQKAGRHMGGMEADPNWNDLETLANMLSDGRLKVSIDQAYPLEAGSQAFQHFNSGDKAGKVVISVQPASGEEDIE